jgi:hypothetical protein
MIEPVIYFVCGKPEVTNPTRPFGYVLMAPYTGCPAPEGYRQEEARTLTEVDRLEKILQRQEYENAEREGQVHEEQLSALRERTRSNLLSKIYSAATSDYEKDFIREFLKMRADHPKKKFYAEQFNCYLTARHFDTPHNRKVDEETVSVDRINVS